MESGRGKDAFCLRVDPVNRHPRVVNFTLFLIVFFILISFSEIALQILNPSVQVPEKPKGWTIIPEESWIEYHPVLGWFHRKNSTAKLDKNKLQVPLSTGALGLRGNRHYSKVKPAGIRRIYAVGDSFTFGFGVRDEEVFTHQMETQTPDLEALNLGIAGYGVDQIFLLLKEFGFSYSPDFVLLVIYPEDFWRATRAFTDAGFGKPYFKLKQNSTLELHHVPVPKDKNFSTPQFPVFREPSPAERLLGWSRLYALSVKARTLIQKKVGLEDPESSPEWFLGRRILKEAVELIRENRAKPVLVIVPPSRWITGTSEPIRQSMLNFAARHNVQAIDLTPVFREASAQKSVDDYYIPDDHHWTALGHQLVAQTLRKELQLD